LVFPPYPRRFYAPWCSHCKALAKGYAAAAEAASGKGLSFGKVDCTQNGGLVKRFGIRVGDLSYF
jgi:thioredoxin-like negative regulator of GroEL